MFILVQRIIIPQNYVANWKCHVKGKSGALAWNSVVCRKLQCLLSISAKNQPEITLLQTSMQPSQTLQWEHRGGRYNWHVLHHFIRTVIPRMSTGLYSGAWKSSSGVSSSCAKNQHNAQSGVKPQQNKMYHLKILVTKKTNREQWSMLLTLWFALTVTIMEMATDGNKSNPLTKTVTEKSQLTVMLQHPKYL